MLLEIVNYDGTTIKEEVDMVSAPGYEGEFGVLKGHIPFITIAKPGQIRYKKGALEVVLAISGGYIEVVDDHIIILAQFFEKPEDINIERAQIAMNKALEKMNAMSQFDDGYEAVQNAYLRALNRIEVAKLKSQL